MFGLLTIFIMALAVSFIFSLILKFTGLTEESISWMIKALSFIAVFIGGFVAGGKGKERGWMIGGITALSYTIIVFLFQYLGFGKVFTLEQTMYHAGFLATAMLGGVAGVNLTTSK
ncbi:TIGR04086 family membrane protein [Metabacillus arenae]|uniref:TIGR04086 family membrane protein n=1 Tax=Metabacillus arenae TaxID=2771434 RepID=UPI0029656313|nr:TIGR04086 family membrane protein [Metabacillus arenae]